MLVGFVNEGERWPQQGKGVKTTHVKVKKKKKKQWESLQLFLVRLKYILHLRVFGVMKNVGQSEIVF